MSSMFGKPRASSERPPQSPLPECNVAILGCRGAGKSALTVKFLTKRFISEYDPNLEDTYSSEELVDQQPVLLKVMDTADQDGPGNCERYLCWASAFLVVYSIDNRKSFEGCQRYLEVLALHARGCQRRCPVLLLGNKLDMEQYRQVLSAEGMSLASRFGCLFHEVSACQDFARVQHVFHEAVRELQGDPLSGPGQAGHRQVLAGSEQKEGSHAHLAERLQDILGHIPVGCREGGERPSSIPPAPQELGPSMMDWQALQQLLADGGPGLCARAKPAVATWRAGRVPRV
ncbi:ras-like protein family member 12 isoform X1 [Passer montanus]|uniref:ras-like protein family member 12 isoform X1 n=1 Tax=Passer montanus TaxID=9160 RepID=UPI0019617E81|nr:ras-like protein family member 12 isoform X1 [Passer montanus]XP_039579064.1 ras-like protein family member 12 isoform X1 [Passer montanus]XP_039579066.1 ras-like protein family member 12 isoform X1 [Passer montanus]